MKKLLVLVAILSILGMVGKVYADNIPVADDPKNYPVVWTASVYNGSGSDITSAYIVQWDFETSNSTALDGTWYDDQCPWVATANASSDIWTAGVVPYGKNIVNGDVGVIIIRGPAYVVEHSTPPTANEICGSHTNGTVTTDAASANTTSLGICIDASPDGLGSGYSLVFVDPTQEAD